MWSSLYPRQAMATAVIRVSWVTHHSYDRPVGEREHSHGHGHHHDRGWRGALRYLRLSRKMWSSPINRAVTGELEIKPNEHVLDIGAGMGSGTVLAARAGARVVAVEPTPF